MVIFAFDSRDSDVDLDSSAEADSPAQIPGAAEVGPSAALVGMVPGGLGGSPADVLLISSELGGVVVASH
eukprot:8349444-Lingulodinium_polyedra.AAC.1